MPRGQLPFGPMRQLPNTACVDRGPGQYWPPVILRGSCSRNQLEGWTTVASHSCSVNCGRMLLCLCALAIAIPGCKADEAKSAGYVDKSVMTKDPSVPFQRTWIKPGFDKSKYTKLYVAPVNTSYMLAETDWQKGVNKAEFEKDVAK